MKQQSRHVLLLVVVTLLVFGNSLANGFVWDDVVYIVRSDFVKKFDLWRVLSSFTSESVIEYFPLRDITVMLDYAIWKGQPFGFHLTNLFFYCLNGVAAYVLAREATLLLHRDDSSGAAAFLPTAALLSGVLFAVHPIHCEVVDAVFNRGALLAGLFSFAASVFFLRFLRREGEGLKAYGGALLCFLLALLSKHYVIILPLLLAFFVLVAGGASWRSRRASTVLSLVPFFLLSVLFYVLFKTIALRTGMLSPELVRLGASNLGTTIAKAIQIPFFYLKMLVVPVGFSAVYDIPFSPSLFSAATILPLLAYVVIVAVAIRVRRIFPELLFGFGWFLITLIPVLNFFNSTPVVADRYVYIPSFGLIYVAATALARLVAGRRALPVLSFSVLLVVVLGGLALRQNTVWKNSVSLWSDVIRKFPTQDGAYVNLGTAYFDQGDNEKALVNYRKAEELSDGNFMAISSEGAVYLRRGEYQAAIDCFRRALSFDEEYLDANFSLASVYERLGNHEKAIYHYNRVLFSPYVDTQGFKAQAKQKVGLLAVKMPRLVALQQAVAARPGDLDLRKDLALTFDALGMYDEAFAAYRELESRGGGMWQLYFNMGNVSKHLQRKQEAAAYYEKCLALNPSYADAWNSLGTVYDSMGEGGRAIAAFRKAIECNAAFSYPYFNLAKAYLKAGDAASARTYFTE
ncbi:MAG TPA: tetratricopeptide repeat protein, partial [Geobacteraceae bacterium]